MSRWTRNSVLLMASLLCFSSHVFASTTATITVNGAEQSGDVNHITIAFNGFVETVNYGPYSTPASIASAFAAMFSRDYLPAGLCANATGSTINFKLQNASFGALEVTGSSSSFQLTSSGFASQGSQIADIGTVTLTINGNTAASTTYGAGATPSSIAAGLAAGVNGGSFVNISAAGDTLNLVSKQAGAGTNYSYSIQTTNHDSTDFSQASFASPPITGGLSGGANAGSDSGQTIYSYTANYDGIGNVSGNSDAVMSIGRFTYDTLNRLVGASFTPFGTGQLSAYICWSYDAFGNRTAQANQGASNCPALPSVPSPTAAYNTNNQVTWVVNTAPSGFQYDQAGNVIQDNLNQYLYDAEGRLCAVASTPVQGMTTYTGYIYDADGARVAKGSITSLSCDPSVNGFQTQSDFVLGPSGEQATEMAMNPDTGGTVWQHTNVWAAGKLFATYETAPNSSSTLHFYLDDPLGSRRVQTDFAGVWEQSCQSLPFGDNESCGTTPTEHLFTGKERDAESGNDYFGARYYASSMGRFLSPDPLGPWIADASDPQSWNFYAYARNNPLINTDPTGFDCVYFNDAGNGVESVDRNSNSGECGQNGGDWVNGTVQSAQYFSDSDTWGFRSSDSSNTYTTYANAPGSETSGIPCSGNCDLANGYFQSSPIPTEDDSLNPYATAVFTQVGLQTGPTYVMASKAFCSAVTFGQAGGFTASVAGMPIPKGWVTTVPSAGGAGVSGVTSLSSAASSAAFSGGDPVITGAAGQFLKSISTSPGSFAGTARIGGAIGRVANKVASSEAAGIVAALGLACIGGHP